jgi:CheY-like chemotaxis protein
MKNTTIILCIDDDEDDLEMLYINFSQLVPEYQIITCNSGEKGLSQLDILKKENRLPGLIVLDINMPKMDGRETLQHIRAIPELVQIPVVIFSTSSSLMDKTYFERMGSAYFVKPVDMDQFQKVVQQLLHYCN